MYIQNFLQKLIYLFVNYNHFIKHNFHYLSSIAMVLKCWRNYLKAVRKAFITLFLKKRFKANLFLTLNQCKIKNNKLNTTNTSDTKDDFQT